MVFSTGKQPSAPLELIFFFFYGMLSIFKRSGEGFTISVRLLHRFKRRSFLYVNSSTRLKPQLKLSLVSWRRFNILPNVEPEGLRPISANFLMVVSVEPRG